MFEDIFGDGHFHEKGGTAMKPNGALISDYLYDNSENL